MKRNVHITGHDDFLWLGRILPFSVLSVCCFLTVTDKDERSLFCPSVSPGFWFRAGNSGLVSINTSKARESCHVEDRSVIEFLPQGVTLVLGRHFEGDGVRGQLRADECPRWATAQMCVTQTLSPVLLGFSQKWITKWNFLYIFFGSRWWRKRWTSHQACLLQTVPSCLTEGKTVGYFHFSDISHKHSTFTSWKGFFLNNVFWLFNMLQFLL